MNHPSKPQRGEERLTDEQKIEKLLTLLDAQDAETLRRIGHLLNANEKSLYAVAAQTIRSLQSHRAAAGREGTWADIGCHVPYTCQSGRGDPPMDCIHPDCFCGDVFIKPEYRVSVAAGREEITIPDAIKKDGEDGKWWLRHELKKDGRAGLPEWNIPGIGNDAALLRYVEWLEKAAHVHLPDDDADLVRRAGEVIRALKPTHEG